MGPLQLSNLILFNVTGSGYRGHRVPHYLHLHVDSLHHPAVPGTKGNINEWLIHCAYICFLHLHPTFKIKFLKLRKEN